MVVPKNNGSVHIFADLKALNQSVIREIHPILRADEILARWMEQLISPNLMLMAAFGKYTYVQSQDF